MILHRSIRLVFSNIILKYVWCFQRLMTKTIHTELASKNWLFDSFSIVSEIISIKFIVNIFIKNPLRKGHLKIIENKVIFFSI